MGQSHSTGHALTPQQVEVQVAVPVNKRVGPKRITKMFVAIYEMERLICSVNGYDVPGPTSNMLERRFNENSITS
jgi:hypothetical protein